MGKMLLFTDGSVQVQSKIGYGAYLFIPEVDIPLNGLEKLIKISRFEQTTSTKLEIQTLLLALNEISYTAEEIIVFTDSQNICSLLNRRKRLERNNFHSKTNQILNNAELYSVFFEKLDGLNVTIEKVKGHKKKIDKSRAELIFTIVDRASRKALRKEIAAK